MERGGGRIVGGGAPDYLCALHILVAKDRHSHTDPTQ